MNYIPTIGLEIHAELKTKSKMFCSSPNNPLETRPNVNVCPVCMGHPGTLPFANKEAIQKVLKVGLALNCSIPEFTKFDRKNYFYPDLPKGYQISQYDMPLATKGWLEIRNSKSEILKIRITRVHLEEDTARLVHPEKMNHSLVDFNRAGVPLMELVTEPDITSSKEASAFARELQTILRYLDVSSADMEKGQMRVEANISVRPENKKELGTKVEVKNLNSFRAVENAIEFEVKRQEEVLESGGAIAQETRGWDDAKNITVSQREKEEAHDYRYFPEPDLPPFRFAKKEVEALRKELPELPQERRKRFLAKYKLPEKAAETLVVEKRAGDFLEESVREGAPAKTAANYILSFLLSQKEWPTVQNFSSTMRMLEAGGAISSTLAKDILATSAKTKQSPEDILKEKGFMSDTKALEALASE
ncbi:MAG: Asp-tRNA(Asn)/Glu-tRNA(Gln) amidotransferase subunit GatB, partial [bacterium]|nr:Asp-tRNA(Asn)/Glu-tRNA(Gln) amidotransferase subunit GatB [bacterium]